MISRSRPASSPFRRFVAALAIALALHAALAVAIALCLTRAPAPDAFAQLDLTSVDLSFAETVEESAAAVASAPSRPGETSDAAPPPADAESPRVSEESPSASDAVGTPRPRDAVLPTLAEPIVRLPAPTIVKTGDEKSPAPPAAPSADAAPRQARVDAPPKPRRNIRPDYPRESRLRGEQGDVTLELVVAADGTVGDVRVLGSPGFPLLDAAAVKAVRAARFTPAKSDGKPVSSTARLTLAFKLK